MGTGLTLSNVTWSISGKWDGYTKTERVCARFDSTYQINQKRLFQAARPITDKIKQGTYTHNTHARTHTHTRTHKQ